MASKWLIHNITPGFSSLLGITVFAILSLVGIAMADEMVQDDASSELQASKADVPGEPLQSSFAELNESTTKSGVKYWDIKVGSGPSPEPGSTVRVHASGWLTSGELFWSSHTKGDPLVRKLTKFIRGWRDGMMGMKVGGIRRLEIPYKLAYGESGRGKTIPPKSDLIFEIELFEVVGLPKQKSEVIDSDEQKLEAKESTKQKPEVDGSVKQTSVEDIEPVTTASGLKYWDIKVGRGASPDPLDRVEVHYSGWLGDGTLFDSSVQRNKRSTFQLSQVIAGWKEGLVTMHAGGVRRLHVPANLAYGESGHPPTIPPNSDLIFEIELYRIHPAPKQRSVEGIDPITTDTGLKYWDIVVGEGDQPAEQSWIKVHYSGWLEDGTLFESSIERGSKPAKYRLDQVMAGWSEGLLSMKVGGARRLEIPASLAYGDQGKPPTIQSNAMLIYDITLLGVMKPPQQTSIEGIEPVVSSTGLKYWDIKIGDGEEPQSMDTVMFHYTGWLENGKLIDSSVSRGEPIGRTIDNLMPGMTQGISSMRVGGKRRLEIPYDLAFGDAGNPPHVPFRANVIYEVELLGLRRR